uniref:Transmembrane protein n=1 Tax=Cacopsylla melanoneura TaxID=428564 RepID=A0A8D8RT10_9HEMI
MAPNSNLFLFSIVQLIVPFFLMYLFCSSNGSTIEWKDLNPYKGAEFNFSKYLGHDLCAENLCLEDFKKAIEQKWDIKLRASCEQDDGLKLTVCWLRCKVGLGSLYKRTKWEMQYWTDKNKSSCRYASP